MPREDTQFKKGQIANPAGRPVGAKNFTTKVREALAKIADGKDYTYEEAFIKSILKKGIVDGDSATQRLIWNYLDGMPMQKTELGIDETIGEVNITIKKNENSEHTIDGSISKELGAVPEEGK